MKKLRWLCLSLIMLCLYATPCNAQAALLVLLFGDKVASENFHFSLKAGANLADISGFDDTSRSLGFNFGLLATIKLGNRLYLVPEFAPLSRKGANDIPYLPTGNADLDELIAPPDESRMDLSYIDIPVIAQYQVADQFRVGTGPYVGIRTGASNVYDREIQEDDELQLAQESQLSWNTFDFGWAFEVVYSLGNARAGKGLNVHARYAQGLTDIIQDNPGDAVRNSVFQFFVSLPFIQTPDEDEQEQTED
jgi:hypothetical protein